MINPFKISDFFIPFSKYCKRIFIILKRNIIYRTRKQTYLENKGIEYAYINENSWIKIDYSVENLVYLKFENYYYFNNQSSIIINLQNLNKNKITLLFKGISDEILYEIVIKNYIKTDFSDFSKKIKEEKIKFNPNLTSNIILERNLNFYGQNISLKSNQFKINLTYYNKSNYVKG